MAFLMICQSFLGGVHFEFSFGILTQHVLSDTSENKFSLALYYLLVKLNLSVFEMEKLLAEI